jgi:hypothetical protein
MSAFNPCASALAAMDQRKRMRMGNGADEFGDSVGVLTAMFVDVRSSREQVADIQLRSCQSRKSPCKIRENP